MEKAHLAHMSLASSVWWCCMCLRCVCVCDWKQSHLFKHIFASQTRMYSNIHEFKWGCCVSNGNSKSEFLELHKKDDRKRCWKWHKLSMATGTGKYISANYVFISSCLPFWAIFKIQERLESKRCKMQQLEPVRAHVATAVAHSETTFSDNVDFVKKWHKFMHLFARQRLFEKLNV